MEAELIKLQSHNAQQKQSGIQDEIDRLEVELRNCEIARKNAQDALEKANDQMNVKAIIFEPASEIQAVSPDLAANFQKLTDQIRQKAKQDNDLKKRKDDLLLEKLKKQGKAELYDQISKAGREFDNMTSDLQSKIANITGDLDGLLRAIDGQKA